MVGKKSNIKWCNKCQKYHPWEYFAKQSTGKYGLKGQCKKWDQLYREQTKEKTKIYNSLRPKKNTPKQTEQERKQKRREYDARPEVKARKQKYDHEYWLKNKKQILEREKRYKENNPIAKLKKVIRDRIYGALKRQKSKHSIEYLGCTAEEYKQFLEKQFTDNMTWENHGDVWEIDHIIPLCQFKLPAEADIAFNYKNTRPLNFNLNRQRNKYFLKKKDINIIKERNLELPDHIIKNYNN